MDNKETIVFVDAGYLSYINRFFGEGKHLKYKLEKFAISLCKEKKLWCNFVYYYTAPPYQSQNPTEEENKRKAGYDTFIEKLKSVRPAVYVREGRVVRDRSGEIHQKGVDTLLTLDLLRTAQRKEVKQIILITADTDFVPVLDVITKEYGMKVILAYFTDRKRKSGLSMSNALLECCNEKILIRKEHLLDIDNHKQE